MTPAQLLVLGIGLNKTGATSLHEALEASATAASTGAVRTLGPGCAERSAGDAGA